MRLIVDSNCLKSARLREFLSDSRQNVAVLPDFVWIEQYRNADSYAVAQALSVLSSFPKQITALKATGAIIKLKPSSRSMVARMCEPRQTKQFSAFCQDVDDARSGNLLMAQAIAERSALAVKFSLQIQESAVELVHAFENIASAFTAEQRKTIYNRHQLDDGAARIVMHAITETYEAWQAKTPTGYRPQNLRQLTDDFQFRHAVSFVMYALEWIRRGKPNAASPEKVRNNHFDILIATYGTYFDGVISDDKLLLEIHKQARSLLADIGARIR